MDDPEMFGEGDSPFMQDISISTAKRRKRRGPNKYPVASKPEKPPVPELSSDMVLLAEIVRSLQGVHEATRAKIVQALVKIFT